MTPAAAAEGPDQAPPLDGEPTAAVAGPTLPPPTRDAIRVAGGWYVPKLDKWGRPDWGMVGG